MARKQHKPPTAMYIDPTLLKSEAFRSLPKKAMLVYFDFLGKRQMAKVGGSKRERWEITNNGAIEFTYKEAIGRGYPQATFMRAIDQLIEKGLLSITKSGRGTYRNKTLFRLDERWRKYGTPDFVKKERPKGTHWVQGKENLKRAHEKNSIPKNDNTAIIKNDNTTNFETFKNDKTKKPIKLRIAK